VVVSRVVPPIILGVCSCVGWDVCEDTCSVGSI